MKKQKGGEDDLAKDLEGTIDEGKFLHFDKDGNPKKAGIVQHVLDRFLDLRKGTSHDPLLPPDTDG